MTIPHYPPQWTATVINNIADILNGFTPSGTYTSHYRYLITTDGTDTYASNAYQTLYGGPSDIAGVDGADSAAVIQAALDNLTGARNYAEIVSISGAYTIGTTIDVPQYTILDLRGATLTLGDGVNDNLLECTTGAGNEAWVALYGGELVGNTANNTAGSGVLFTNGYQILIDGTKIRDFDESGVKLDTTGVAWINHSRIIDNGEHGVLLSSASDGWVTDCDIGGNGFNGICVSTGAFFHLNSNKLYMNVYDGLDLFEVRNTEINFNQINKNNLHGIHLRGTDANYNKGNKIIANTILQNSQDAVNTYSGICCDGAEVAQNVIQSNRVSNADHKYCLEFVNAPTTNIISGNFLYDATTAITVGIDHTTNKVYGNVGWVTENSGTGSIANATTADVITHGMSYTPRARDITITLTENPSNTPGAIWVDTITATEFTVNCENDPGASNLDFEWSCRLTP